MPSNAKYFDFLPSKIQKQHKMLKCHFFKWVKRSTTIKRTEVAYEVDFLSCVLS